MNFLGYLTAALANLKAAKLRSFLAILGILIGTGSVVALVSSGELATRTALAQFKSLGTNLLSVSIYPESQSSNQANTVTKKLSLKAALAITTADPNILITAPYVMSYSQINYQGQNLEAGIIGATQDLQTGIQIQLLQGRFVSTLDNYSSFCVIGYKLYQQILASGVANPIGSQITLGKDIFTIIGVEAYWPENSFFDQDINTSIIIPIETSLILNKYTSISNIIFRLKEGAAIEPIKQNITNYLAQVAPHNSLFIRSAEELLAKMQAQQQTFTLLLGIIGSISLLVGGIGVMNIMLVSVVERRREIGIRRAVGAKKRDIQMLFVVESTILSLYGGILGVLFGVLASFIIAKLSHWEFTLFFMPPIIGFLVSAAIGIFFGFYPAYRAAQLDPIETLHSE